ncbi:MAG TPA: lytic transglycosylase domain-containing protein [Thermoanaerobaculia bacterium]|nr:lytic transglycosylase domain-containing protein [Thermoanaerobaculia bacterium]
MANNLNDSIAARFAKLRRAAHKRPILRLLGGRGAATIALAGMLSAGGLTQALDGVHFLVRKDLDAVRVVKQDGRRVKVVAKIDDGFAGNSVFKLSRVLPDSLVTQQNSLFSDRWIAMPQQPASAPQQRERDVFHEEMARINTVIKRDFATAVPFGSIIHEKAEKYDVDPALVAAVVETESRFRTRARSQVGAKGLMQLMPRTGKWMGARNLYDPAQNVDAGAKYLRYLSRRFDGDQTKMIAAYNAGEGNVKRYNGVPPFRETRNYVKRVMTHYHERKQQMKELRQKHGAGTPEPQLDSALTVR